MANSDRHSTLVQIFKIVLPLVALAILSTLFLVSSEVDPESAIPFADVDVEQIAREQRLSNPRFAAIGNDGAAIELSASEARPNPDNSDELSAFDIDGQIEIASGVEFRLQAGAALVNLAEEVAGLTDNILVTTSNGYTIKADQLMTFMDRAEMTSNGPVDVVTPFGTLQAGNMALTRSGDSHRLVFNNQVKLVYQP